LIVVGTTILTEFVNKHGDVRGQVSAWLLEVKAAKWQSPADLKARFSSASFLPGNRIVFNLKGNKYRLEVIMSFRNQTVMVRRIGTHAEYSKW
jgi:mRNA interferase HigB